MGVVFAGAVPTILATPNPRLHPDKFRQGLSGMLDHSGFDWILTEHNFDGLLTPLLKTSRQRFRGVLYPSDIDIESFQPVIHAAAGADDPCLLQHSSGTTGLQKPVVLSHRSVSDHLDTYAASIALDPNDRIVSWLPLYHDMGLITSFHMPLRFGLTLIQLDPVEWVKAPISLLEAISANRATLSWMPNFAFNLIAQRLDDQDRCRLALASMRLLVNCSETVRAATHEQFLASCGSCGLDQRSLGASYAMAETTFAVTQTPLGAPARILNVDPAVLVQGRVISAPGREGKSYVSSGRCLPDCRIQIRDERGCVLGEDCIGEIFVGSKSLFSGYRNRPEATAVVLKDGWYQTGDIGFLHDEELYVIGRKKDIIIVAGKNIQPEDIEDAVSTVPGILPGRVVALGVSNEDKGTEDIYVLAETRIEAATERKKLKLAVLRAGMDLDLTITDVILLEPRQMVKSSSGKPARAANRIYLPPPRST
jgi:acyl-CoA synthetase (AMP-forming)/AMP-acid ligase II